MNKKPGDEFEEWLAQQLDAQRERNETDSREPAEHSTEIGDVLGPPTEAYDPFGSSDSAPAENSDPDGPPTEAYDPFESPTEALSSVDAPTELLNDVTTPAVASPLSGSPSETGTDADSPAFAAEASQEELLSDIFGDDAFHDYGSGIISAPGDPKSFASEPLIGGAPGASPSDGGRRGAAKPGSGKKTLIWTLIGVLGLAALGVLFVLGTQLPSILGPAPVAEPSASPSPSVEPEPQIGPLEPGVYRWNELLGGECLQPYSSPWVEEFTVVDCDTPHQGQLVLRAPYPPEIASQFGYPGEAVLRAELSLYCTDPEVVDYEAASAYSDIQFDSSYPVDLNQWVEEPRDYFCFLSRESGEAIVGTLALPQVEADDTEGSEDSAE